MALSERLLSCSGAFTTTWLPLQLSLSSQIMWKVPGRHQSFIAVDCSKIGEQLQVHRELYLASLTLLLHRTPCCVRYTFSHKLQAEFLKSRSFYLLPLYSVLSKLLHAALKYKPPNFLLSVSGFCTKVW